LAKDYFSCNYSPKICCVNGAKSIEKQNHNFNPNKKPIIPSFFLKKKKERRKKSPHKPPLVFKKQHC
jgi:hypothetical protein